ncbi:flavin reductase family protein [Prauserella aidingensis]|uniref:flavin reductase family protein n=1 Tax=Prauserella aidingensis TaxID=387890 RepID=UPI0020A39F50|nr:flavin reductase family protein [Prauserella aidingensis]
MDTTMAERQVPLGERFRDVMAGVCTPVSVVTAVDPAAAASLPGDSPAGTPRPHGTTVSAFASLSMEPPMVLAALDLRSDLLALLEPGTPFGVNVLGSDQSELAVRFAGKGRDKFDGVTWNLSGGVPRLEGVPGWLACRVDRLVEGGDHVIALGLVTAAERTDTPPLTYHAREFGTHTTTEGGGR